MEQEFKQVEYKINVFKSLTNNANVEQNSSPNSTSVGLQPNISDSDSKLLKLIMNFNTFVCQKEKALEVPFGMDLCDSEGEQSSFSSSSHTEDMYKEHLLSEGFDSTHCANVLK
jgi:hypothetical protein